MYRSTWDDFVVRRDVSAAIESGEERAAAFAAFWRPRLEAITTKETSLDVAAGETAGLAARDFGRLTAGTEGYDFRRALSMLARDMPDGHLLREWNNRRQVER